MHPGWKGMLLGAANVLFVAVGYGISDDSSHTTLIVMIVGALPGLITGLLLGLLASSMASQSALARSAVLISLAVFVVFVLGNQFGFMDHAAERQLVFLATIPTAVAALVLERWTRRVDDPPIPCASAR